MKRGAERQISKGEDDADEIEEISGDKFSKADDAVLATRKIKGMPRRMAGSPSPFPASPSDSASANGSEVHPCYAPAVQVQLVQRLRHPGQQCEANLQPLWREHRVPDPVCAVLCRGAGVASTASNAAKTFASFLGGDSPAKPAPAAGSSSAPPPPPQLNPPAPTSEGDAVDDAALKYYTSLRGLNVSILAAITKAIDQDPFTDVAALLTRYSSLRVDVQKEFDERAQKQPDVPARSSAPSPSPFGTPTPAPPPAAAPKMPAPPSAFSGFGRPAAAAAAAAPAPKTNGALAPPAPPRARSDLGPPHPPPPLPPPPHPPPRNPHPASMPTPSAFGAAPTSSLFGSATGSPFGAAAAASPFGASPFGSKPASSNLFGGGGGFGAASPFGSGSIGNPVGFGFGSPKGAGSPAAETGGKEKEEADGDGDKDGDGDGNGDGEASGSGSQKTEADTDAGATEEGGASAPGSTGNMLFGAETLTGMDAEGEGEEDEETVHSARIKAYRMRRKEDTETGWLELGLGIVRLKKHKETDTRRLLLRNSHSGKIQINFALYSQLKPSLSKKSLTFVGHGEKGESQTYSLRFRSEEAAKEFKEFLEQELKQVK
ncbi:hypothetical protein B0H17DRAFT_1063305 [Mycena rosella]|uniref:RanBD1 domain-containing protein n=1 Tax=Mycena rosella TaxID=1033263 RepID=A0AAD7GEW2_MYCRO|nr:hypothetical protein B0H17DRAFT_1063305 [Mycena rosella]